MGLPAPYYDDRVFVRKIDPLSIVLCKTVAQLISLATFIAFTVISTLIIWFMALTMHHANIMPQFIRADLIFLGIMATAWVVYSLVILVGWLSGWMQRRRQLPNAIQLAIMQTGIRWILHSVTWQPLNQSCVRVGKRRALLANIDYTEQCSGRDDVRTHAVVYVMNEFRDSAAQVMFLPVNVVEHDVIPGPCVELDIDNSVREYRSLVPLTPPSLAG